ncbi:hypothetical protein SGO26_09115 [Cupriavidus metallidurans]|uniref:hypothetical protein n=1 Tax=Cupriavidus TaxID=106589 RepID=UPI00295EB8FF|nr:hypothetical protein [Cupriavidus sp. TKC]
MTRTWPESYASHFARGVDLAAQLHGALNWDELIWHASDLMAVAGEEPNRPRPKAGVTITFRPEHTDRDSQKQNSRPIGRLFP